MAVKGKKQIEKTIKSLERLKVEYVDINSIRPNDYNPNRESEYEFDLLLRSMKEDGFTQPIICQKNRIIVDGEHRWRAGKELGYKEIPVVFVDMSQEQMKIATLRHNRARGSEDVELTAELFRDLEKLGALDWAKDSLKLTDVEVDRIMKDIPVSEALAGEIFSQSWKPISPDEKNSVKLKETQASMGVVGEAMSLDGYNMVRDREKKIKEAKSEQEKENIKKESNVYRLSLVFTKEQFAIIQEILGDNPAEKLLEICKNEKLK
jgi:hypothetical protein